MVAPAALDEIRRGLAEVLTSDESVVAAAHARLPVRRRDMVAGDVGVYPSILWTVARRLDESHRATEMAKTYRAGGLATAPKMVLVATNHRLLVLEVDLGWTPVHGLGAIDRADLAEVTLPYVGNGPWKRMRIRLRSGLVAELLIDRPSSAAFVAAFA